MFYHREQNRTAVRVMDKFNITGSGQNEGLLAICNASIANNDPTFVYNGYSISSDSCRFLPYGKVIVFTKPMVNKFCRLNYKFWVEQLWPKYEEKYADAATVIADAIKKVGTGAKIGDFLHDFSISDIEPKFTKHFRDIKDIKSIEKYDNQHPNYDEMKGWFGDKLVDHKNVFALKKLFNKQLAFAFPSMIKQFIKYDGVCSNIAQFQKPKVSKGTNVSGDTFNYKVQMSGLVDVNIPTNNMKQGQNFSVYMLKRIGEACQFQILPTFDIEKDTKKKWEHIGDYVNPKNTGFTRGGYMKALRKVDIAQSAADYLFKDTLGGDRKNYIHMEEVDSGVFEIVKGGYSNRRNKNLIYAGGCRKCDNGDYLSIEKSHAYLREFRQKANCLVRL